MKIQFKLAWATGNVSQKSFKHRPAYEIFEDFRKRISHFSDCEVSALSDKTVREPGQVWWFCDRSEKSKILSSEDVSRELEKLQGSGVREWVIVIGGADGFKKEDYDRFIPERLWSFGTMTLPHELAAVVAAEQIYRAWTILKKLPYHSKH